MPPPATDEELRLIDAYWRAANFLTVGQIYLKSNPLLREPLTRNDIKPRLLGHWGTSPGLNLLYAHLNRIIRREDANVVFLAGPGHGGPAILANVYLEGTYSEIYSRVPETVAGMQELFRQFSTPGGVPSHVSPPTPGSIHEGGELGYVLTHAFGAVFDNPDLVAVAVVGDGEAETGPLEGSWKGIHFLNPARDGAVLPVLHLNGYKISGPTVLGRSNDEAIGALLGGHGYDVHFVEGEDPPKVHRDLARTLDACWVRIRAIQEAARTKHGGSALRWPAIVLRTPKGWTGPKVVDGVAIEGTFRAHQVPLANVRDDASHLAQLDSWMKSYDPAALFDENGALVASLRALVPAGSRRMGANPHANGGGLSVPLDLPAYTDYAIPVPRPATEHHESTHQLGLMLRDIYRKNPTNFRLFCPDETNSNRLGAVFEASKRCFMEPTFASDESIGPDGRVMEVLSEHNCEGWLEGYLLTGRHGLFASYEAFALIVASMATQHAKWLEVCHELPWRKPVPSLNYLLTSTCWRNDHNGFSHQGPGFMDTVMSKKAWLTRVYLPPDANCLLSVADHCFRSKNYVNLIIIDKQPQLQWLDMAAAEKHCAAGASIWDWASTANAEREPDIVMASAGDIPTLETIAAAWWLRKYAPDLAVRVVNVVDLMALSSPDDHPHGLAEARFLELFTQSTDVVLAFHGYPALVHEVLHGRPNAPRFHVRGYREEGTTTTPFDMVVRNGMSRYHLIMEALKRCRRPPANAEALVAECQAMLVRHHAYIREYLEDLPEVQEWTWAAT